MRRVGVGDTIEKTGTAGHNLGAQVRCVMSDRQDLFTLASNNRGARTRRAAGEKCIRTNIRKNSFAVRIVDSWNQLPESRIVMLQTQ